MLQMFFFSFLHLSRLSVQVMYEGLENGILHHRMQYTEYGWCLI